MPPIKNPLIYREWRSIGPKRFAVTISLVLVVLGVLLLREIMAESYRSGVHTAAYYRATGTTVGLNWTRIAQNLGILTMGFQLLIACYGAFGRTASSISAEHHQNTYDLFVTLPISPMSKVWGLAVGRNITTISLLVLLTPVGLLCSWYGGVPIDRLLWYYVLLACGMTTAALAGMAITKGLGARVVIGGPLLSRLMIQRRRP